MTAVRFAVIYLLACFVCWIIPGGELSPIALTVGMIAIGVVDDVARLRIAIERRWPPPPPSKGGGRA